MNEQELQLIEWYMQYIRKRRIIFFIISLFFILSAGILFFYINFDNSNIIEEPIIQEEIIDNSENEIVNNNISNSISNEIDEVKEEKPKEVVTESKPVTQENEKVVEVSKPSKPTSSERKEEDKQKQKPSNKDFLFSDGYNMDNVTSAAQEYLKSSGYAGECIPLQDQEGIYIGMRVIFY